MFSVMTMKLKMTMGKSYGLEQNYNSHVFSQW
jgi:hypothetical protein